LVREFPALQTRGLQGAAEYFDAQMDDARLCLEVIGTATLQGACAANYVEAVGFLHKGGTIAGARVVDRAGGAEFDIRARQVLNATGPWVDAVCRLAGDDAGPHLQPTKGVHIVLPAMNLRAAFLLLHPGDGRVFFVIPWMGKTLVGTTDTLTQAGPDALHVLPEEIDYLLAGFQHFFPGRFGRRDLLACFAGLRPLLFDRQAPSARSREFRILESATGLMSAAGGKYTTYRRMAEEITDRIAERLGCVRRCRTAALPLLGAPRVPWHDFAPAEVTSLCQHFGLEAPAARHLVDRYGQRAAAVAVYLATDPSLAQPIVAGEPDLWAEIRYQAEQEMALVPEDHLLRRTRLGVLRPVSERLREAVAAVASGGRATCTIMPAGGC
jgi:glycerol-3-phosphate dehydrogenase